MTWDALQREMLGALGHTLYVICDSPATREQDAACEAIPERNERDRSMLDRPARDRNATSPDSLLRALLRAANLGEDNVPSLQSQLPPLHTLAGNANAKRALWPMLRALRAVPDAK